MTAGFIAEDVSWLPLATRRALQGEAWREAREARGAELDHERRADAKRSAAITLAAQQAAERGEVVSAMDIAAGRGGRTVGEVLASAAILADREDERAEVMQRRPRGERLNIDLAEVPATRCQPETAEGREIINTVRHYARQHPDSDVLDRAAIAAEARRALRQNRPVI